ncbi:hypothetical protein C8F04DRAFT_1315473 [Mycena alexandri]|uniref:Uncharacterized protein n=1 Tax=Mycena alexandri TaxID=1745969 RepID=A0AAD6S6C0_9AGAR|nr:hypothetical protein C8F04DRAFT_1315473 [Mycena alexandri]
MADRYLAELGDALIIGTCAKLEQAAWNGSKDNSEFSRFHVQDASDGMLTILDLPQEIQFLLPRTRLLDQNFDLIAWYRSELEDCKRKDAEYDLATISESDAELLTYESSADSVMPLLESVSDSDNEGECADESAPMARFTREVIQENARIFTRRVMAPRRIRDLLENGAQLILEVSQPYPGDERAAQDERRQRPRFNVERVSDNCYVVVDEYFKEISVLPLEYLRVPAFSLACWYANIRAIECDIEEFDFLRTHRATVRELLVDEITRYLAENSEKYPILSSTSVRRILRDPDDLEGPDTFLLRIQSDGVDFVDFLDERDLPNTSR